MTPAEILALFNALVSGAQTLAPIVSQIAHGGAVSAEEQQALKKRIDALRQTTDLHFTGPEWTV